MKTLPEELVEQVVSHIDCPASLANVNLANQQLNRVSTPFLYRHVSIICQHPLLLDRPLRALTTTVVTRPELAAHVQTLSLRPIWQFPSQTKQEVHPVLVAAIDTSSVDEQTAKRWKCDAQVARNLDALLALLVPRLTNLIRLNIEIPPKGGEWWIHVLEDRSSSIGRNLDELVLKSCNPSALREMANRAPGDYDHASLLNVNTAPMDANTIISYARAFTPRILRVHYAGETDYDRDIRYGEIQLRLAGASQGRTDTVPVEHLELRKAATDMEFIWDLLTACEALRTFIFEYGSGYWLMDDMVATLQLHKDSLQNLYLDVYNGNATNPVDGLSGLTQLRELHIVAGLLFVLNNWYDAGRTTKAVNKDVIAKIPPQLSRLKIMRGEHRDRGVEEFVNASLEPQKDFLPALRRLDVEASDLGSGLSLLSRLLEQVVVAESTGITLELIARTRVGSWVADEESGWGFDGEDGWLTPFSEQKDTFQPVTREIADMLKKRELTIRRDRLSHLAR